MNGMVSLNSGGRLAASRQVPLIASASPASRSPVPTSGKAALRPAVLGFLVGKGAVDNPDTRDHGLRCNFMVLVSGIENQASLFPQGHKDKLVLCIINAGENQWEQTTETTTTANGKTGVALEDASYVLDFKQEGEFLLNLPIIEFFYRTSSIPAFSWAFLSPNNDANNSDNIEQRSFLPAHLPESSADAVGKPGAISKWSDIIFSKAK